MSEQWKTILYLWLEDLPDSARYDYKGDTERLDAKQIRYRGEQLSWALIDYAREEVRALTVSGDPIRVSFDSTCFFDLAPSESPRP